ncbi:MAG TPA: imidazolonepropionase [Actinomycetota bacterium]|nr:imidazolonepropionase [Actinomycetota bacterium]
MPEQPETPSRGALIATTVVTPIGPAPVRGARLDEVRVLHGGSLAWEDGTLVFVGPASELPAGFEAVDHQGCTVVPGFVDCHTHLPFVGWRADEFETRLAGRSYRELHGEGGIYRSARLLAEASDEQVLNFCGPLVREMADHGTTTLELKTGYGLSVEGELRQARLAHRLAEIAPQRCLVTLLACHAVPQGRDRASWVRAVCEELIPEVAEASLADAVDVYVEDIAFSTGDLQAVAEAATLAGMGLRCHADQLGDSGAAAAAVALGSRSADHLNHLNGQGIEALGAGTTVATVLPASTFVLRETSPPVRRLLEAQAALALATDFNPGTSPVLSMPEAIAMGCTLYGLTPHQALTAATANPAWVLGVADRTGTLEPGKRADFLVLEGDAFAQVPYRPGHDPVLHTFVGGRRVAGR